MYKYLLIIFILVLAACSPAQIAQMRETNVLLMADAKTVTITGCRHAPAIQAALAVVVEFLPPGTDKDKLKTGLVIAEAQVPALCAKLQEPASRAIALPADDPARP